MNAHTDPQAASFPEPDVVDTPDYGTMNRELLAEKLAVSYWGPPASIQDMGPATAARWLRVVDVAIAELQGTP